MDEMTANEQGRCPLCGWDAKVAHLGDADRVDCVLCGEFKVTGALLRIAFADKDTEEAKDLLPFLSVHTRQANERGEIVTLDTNNWRDFALAHKGTSVPRKATKLLELIAARSKPGSPVRFDAKTDPPLVGATSSNELEFLLEHLKETGCLRRDERWVYTLKAKGWERLDSATAGSGIPGKCFVAMSFDASLKEAYDKGIHLAVKEDCKMDPVRIDHVHHNEKICDRILEEIRTCQFMVADFTRQRSAVFFEAGFALGLGRPVIWSCREDEFETLKESFDTRQYNHIVWQTAEDLRVKLTDRVRATIPPRG
jgi:hypothetical protein